MVYQNLFHGHMSASNGTVSSVPFNKISWQQTATIEHYLTAFKKILSHSMILLPHTLKNEEQIATLSKAPIYRKDIKKTHKPIHPSNQSQQNWATKVHHNLHLKVKKQFSKKNAKRCQLLALLFSFIVDTDPDFLVRSRLTFDLLKPSASKSGLALRCSLPSVSWSDDNDAFLKIELSRLFNLVTAWNLLGDLLILLLLFVLLFASSVSAAVKSK